MFLFLVVPGKGGGVTAWRSLLDRGYRNIHLLAFTCDYCNNLFHTLKKLQLVSLESLTPKRQLNATQTYGRRKRT